MNDDLEPALKKYVDNFLFKRFSQENIGVLYPTIRRNDTNKETGTQTSQDGETAIDWSKGEFSVSRAGVKRVTIGNIDGLNRYGIRIKSQSNLTRFESSDTLEQLNAYDSDEILRFQAGDLSDGTSQGTLLLDGDGNVRLESSTNRHFQNIVRPQLFVSATDNIQTAINYLNTNFPTGGDIFLDSATYNLTDNITLYPYINLFGVGSAGYQETVLDFGGSESGLVLNNSYSNYIKGIVVTNSYTNTALTTGAIKITSSNQITINDCSFENSLTGGGSLSDIYCLSSTQIQVEKCLSINSYQFVSTDNTTNLRVTDNEITTSNYSIKLANNDGRDIISGNRFVACDSDCVNVSGSTANHKLNVTNNMAKGITSFFCTIASLNSANINGNSLLGASNSGAGIYLNGCNYCVITGNTTDTMNRGAYLVSSDRNVIVGNTFVNGVRGIWIFDAASNNNNVSANVCYNNSTANITDTGTGTVTDGTNVVS